MVGVVIVVCGGAQLGFHPPVLALLSLKYAFALLLSAFVLFLALESLLSFRLLLFWCLVAWDLRHRMP